LLSFLLATLPAVLGQARKHTGTTQQRLARKERGRPTASLTRRLNRTPASERSAVWPCVLPPPPQTHIAHVEHVVHKRPLAARGDLNVSG